MNLNQCPGTNSAVTSTAAGVSELPLGSDDGSHTSGISGVMVDEKLAPTDNLSAYGLGPC